MLSHFTDVCVYSSAPRQMYHKTKCGKRERQETEISVPFVAVCALHLCDGLWEVCGDLGEALPSTVHDVVATGARLWTLDHTAGGAHGHVVTYTEKNTLN